MVLKFYMQHDEAASLQKDKIQVGQASKMAAVTKKIASKMAAVTKKKIAKTLKSFFSPEPLDKFG